MTDQLEQSLINCIQVSPHLEKLTVSSSSLLPEEPAVRVPAMVTAMRSNYTLKTLCLQYDRIDVQGHWFPDPWDSGARIDLDMITSLNHAGQAYLLTEPTDRLMGLHVLKQVKDNLSCLFFHLLENPSLVDSMESGVAPPPPLGGDDEASEPQAKGVATGER
jgi:hypothetical protein